jgi:hypothetical protein
MSHHAHDQSKHHVGISLDRDHDHTSATARLHWRESDLVGVGVAEIDRDEADPKRTAEEQAVARALIHLTKQMYDGVAADIESVTGEPVSVR